MKSDDALLAAQLSDAVTVEITASYSTQLVDRLKERLNLPVAVKLMYADPDFGELCLMTSLAELESECDVVLKAVPKIMKTGKPSFLLSHFFWSAFFPLRFGVIVFGPVEHCPHT